jgi:hypothetical protein
MENDRLKNSKVKDSQGSLGMGSVGMGEAFGDLKKLNADVDKDTLVELYNYLLMKHFRMMRDGKVRESEESKSTDAFTLKQKSCVLSGNTSFVFTEL